MNTKNENITHIKLINGNTNNLSDLSICIPHNKLTVITGISGSGKSSLIFDTVAKEGQRRFFETLPSFAQQYAGKLSQSDVEAIEGLSPVIAISQQKNSLNNRSTVGTLSDIYILLRLLYARLGQSEKGVKLSRSLFSFNSPTGRCEHCNGIGKEEKIDLTKLVTQPTKTIREGALSPTLPTGYIMYSQVTIEALNELCIAEGFSVDIPWNQLTETQQNIILYGSEKIKVPFGKHSLESRLKWTGIKAKPREEGFYKGMIHIMSDILRRDRNANILKYAHSITCSVCKGQRINTKARSVTVHGKTISELTQLELHELSFWLKSQKWDTIGEEISRKLIAQIELLCDLGLSYLCTNRSAETLTGSEIQRIRFANQVQVGLSNVTYIFDEPSIGLHPEENRKMIYHLRSLVKQGNTVIVVEHDLDTIRQADWIIEIGPLAGVNGGKLQYSGSLNEYLSKKRNTPTYKALTNAKNAGKKSTATPKNQITLSGCVRNNLKNISVTFQLGQLNVVYGKSGSGKKSLIKHTLIPLLNVEQSAPKVSYSGIENIDNVISIDQSPIGRTPRSNPATYLGIANHIRDTFAQLPTSKQAKYGKSRFSFNNQGGRCETCQGAGKTQIGMHFLGKIDLTCETCNGKRFNEETLEIKLNELNIFDVYQLSIDEAIHFFEEYPKIKGGLLTLQEIGLGYLKLGQASTTLSGGEAQRIKLANHLQKKDTGNTVYILEEPSIGLHHYDIEKLLLLFDKLTAKGNTIICIEQDESILAHSDWQITLGPGSGKAGGKITYQGKPQVNIVIPPIAPDTKTRTSNQIHLTGVTTHLLQNISVQIPKNILTVVTGLSGSGKSSLAYDTLFAEANSRFTSSLSTYSRSYVQQSNPAKVDSAIGLTPTIAVRRKKGNQSKRSTVGTSTGIYTLLRLLYSRIAQENNLLHTAQHFSFNHQLGACISCDGNGSIPTCNPNILIEDDTQTIFDNAFISNKALKFYTGEHGQFMAIFKEVARSKNWNITRPWNKLSATIQECFFYGTGNEIWETTWHFKTKTKSGTQDIKARWLGLCNYIDDEYQRKLHNKNIEHLEVLLHHKTCSFCRGSRLKPELLATTFQDKNIHELGGLSISNCLKLLNTPIKNERINGIANATNPRIISLLETMEKLGLGYLSLNRSTKSLSGGELQRVTLAGSLSHKLFGVTYILDEPTIGLAQNQINELLSMLHQLIRNGNTVVVVEHDKSVLKHADYLIEMGPASGKKGGKVIYQGDIENLTSCTNSITLKLLKIKSHPPSIPIDSPSAIFGVRGANENNLKSIDVNFYSNRINAIKGISGSGKSTLMKEVLFPSFSANQNMGCASILGQEFFDNVLLIDQDPISTSAIGTVASYLGILESIKAIFGRSAEAKMLNLKKADFSYQGKTGKCVSCNGYGRIKTSMDFMSDIWLPCDSCNGLRYNDQVLDCKINQKSIGDVLRLTIDEAIAYFSDKKLEAALEQAREIGIGHLTLGQAGNTLSGGESQRIKLAKELIKPQQGNILYLLDEPSTGLHYFDILKLISTFEKLLKLGHTVLFIEHNETLLNMAHHTIELGPESGENGGQLI